MTAEAWVTGAAVLTPFGDLPATLAGLSHGVSAIRPGAFSVASVAGGPGSDRAAHFLCAVAGEALAAARVEACARAYVGTCSGAMDVFQAWWDGAAAARQFYVFPPENLLGEGTRGPSANLHILSVQMFSSACTSSLAALWAAFRQLGDAPVLVAGTDALCDFTTRGFLALKATDTEPCRPFSPTRKGLSFGEGAAALILESPQSAERRGVKPLFKIAGVGLSADAAHRTAPRADGKGLELAIRRACAHPETADVYIAHGTGTQASDAAELTLGERLGWRDKPWLAHKAYLGHAMGASGLISLVLGAEQMRAKMNFKVPYTNAEAKLEGSLEDCTSAIVGAAAFGGSNAAAWVRL